MKIWQMCSVSFVSYTKLLIFIPLLPLLFSLLAFTFASRVYVCNVKTLLLATRSFQVQPATINALRDEMRVRYFDSLLACLLAHSYKYTGSNTECWSTLVRMNDHISRPYIVFYRRSFYVCIWYILPLSLHHVQV